MINIQEMKRDYIGAPELCKLLGTTRQNLRSLANAKSFPTGEKAFGTTLFPRAEVMEWIKTYKPRKKPT